MVSAPEFERTLNQGTEEEFSKLNDDVNACITEAIDKGHIYCFF